MNETTETRTTMTGDEFMEAMRETARRWVAQEVQRTADARRERAIRRWEAKVYRQMAAVLKRRLLA